MASVSTSWRSCSALTSWSWRKLCVVQRSSRMLASARSSLDLRREGIWRRRRTTWAVDEYGFCHKLKESTNPSHLLAQLLGGLVFSHGGGWWGRSVVERVPSQMQGWGGGMCRRWREDWAWSSRGKFIHAVIFRHPCQLVIRISEATSWGRCTFESISATFVQGPLGASKASTLLRRNWTCASMTNGSRLPSGEIVLHLRRSGHFTCARGRTSTR